MDIYPNNTASQFTTKLSEVVELEGNWEVGLLETSFPGKVSNVFGSKFSYTLHRTRGHEDIECTMSNGIYHSISAVLIELRRSFVRAVNKASEPMVTFDVSQRSRRVFFSFTEHSDNVDSLEFSSDLATMLGYEPNRRYVNGIRREIKAEKPLHLSAKINSVFIYCDLLEHVMVGDTKSPLLRIVNRKTDVRQAYDSVEHVTFNPVQYVPLQKKCFDAVAIQLMTDFGEAMPFVPGKSLVVLEFRRTTHPYLVL